MIQGVFIKQSDFDKIKKYLYDIESEGLDIVHLDTNCSNFKDRVNLYGRSIFGIARKAIDVINKVD